MRSPSKGFDPNQKRADDGTWTAQHGTRPTAGSLTSPVTDETTPALAGLDPEVYRKANEYFTQIARSHLAPFGNTTGADDAVQDAFESILRQAADQGRDINEILGAYEHRGLRARVINTTAGWQHPDAQNKERHEYIKARKELAEAERLHHEQHNRGFTKQERAAAAEQIRMQWPAKSRPRADFYVKDTFVSFDAPTGTDQNAGTIGDITTEPAYLTQAPDDETDENAGFALGEIRMAMDADERDKAKGIARPGHAAGIRKAIRATMWNDVIVTGSNELPVPPVRENRIPREYSTEIRQTIADAGGPSALTARWLDKDPTITREQERALFAPFAPEELPPSQLEAAALALDDRPLFADRLWADALSAATQD